MATFELSKTEVGQFNFSLRGEEEKTLLRSEQYTSKSSAQNGIESIRKNAAEDKRYELKESSNGKFYFNLKAVNGQVIGTSPMFGSDEARSAAIAQVKSKAATAGVVEDL